MKKRKGGNVLNELPEIRNLTEGMGISMINVPAYVCDSEVFWTTLENGKGFKLQQHVITGHVRIINKKSLRIAWGDLRAMKESYRRLMKPWEVCRNGDILAVKRLGGVYSHYAVYVGNGKVIHYASRNGDFGSNISIHKADFSEFLLNELSYEILSFSKEGDRPKHRRIDLIVNGLGAFAYPEFEGMPEFEKYLRKLKGYHIYSPEETVARAESRIGEKNYNLPVNNCEHFALWCKTGVHESTQVEDVLFNLLSVGLKHGRIISPLDF